MVDEIPVMTVNPGWGGQPFIETSPDKVRRMRSALIGDDVLIEVDGGIGTGTAGTMAAAGATPDGRRLGDLRFRSTRPRFYRDIHAAAIRCLESFGVSTAQIMLEVIRTWSE